jgi:hypothetical protein
VFEKSSHERARFDVVHLRRCCGSTCARARPSHPSRAAHGSSRFRHDLRR